MTGPFATRLFRLALLLAGRYNLVFGLWAGFFPLQFFELFELPPPRYPSLWACLGMVVGVYGLLYWYAAWKPDHAAGPFRSRSPALLDSAIEIGFDVIDINDDLNYAELVLQRLEPIGRAGIAVLSSASSVSAISAAVVRQSKVERPVRLTGFLAPASRHTSNAGSALSLIGSVGRPVRVLREGRLRTAPGWGESRRFPMPAPLGTLRAWLFESADALYLPRIWPSLSDVSLYVDTNTPGVNGLLRLAAIFPGLRRLLERQVRLGTGLSRMVGSRAGGLG